MLIRLVSLIALACLFVPSLSGQKAEIFGVVLELPDNKPVEFVTVYLEGTSIATETDAKGAYSLEVDADKEYVLIFSRVGYEEVKTPVDPLGEGLKRKLDALLRPNMIDEFVVRESIIRDGGVIRQDAEAIKLLPTTTGNLENVLPAIALGTSSGTGGELSSQYNVRGGNYDENLIYVNDFEIYRPQLIRSGQQEGLTFANLDLIRDLSFSSGGYEAKYGDKLSSVLDVKYKRPEAFRASVGMSFLGGSAHIEGSKSIGNSIYRKIRYLVGARYKTTRYLLGSLDVDGEYNPNFTDIQAYVTYDINRNLQLAYLTNYNNSVYNFVPQERSTALGLIDFTLELFSVFEGQERDRFSSYMNGLSLTYIPDRDYNPFYLKFLGSYYTSVELERFDILGYYSLREIEGNPSEDNFGEVLSELGNGTQQQYTRNQFQANVANLEHKGGWEIQRLNGKEDVQKSHFFQWGVKYQYEDLADNINEWERLDSAGYSLPYDTNQVSLDYVLKSENELQSHRVSAYFQDTYNWERDSVGELRASLGLRFNHWTLNGETFITPRMQILYKPLKKRGRISYRLASGLYYQSAFYRELRLPDGSLNQDLLSQKSWHIVGGVNYDFPKKNDPSTKYRLIVEAYYKKLWDMVSFDVDNVRIRYSGENDSKGYVAGVDLRLNGEFVPGAESWINLSLLRARESLDGVTHLKRELGQTEAQEVVDVPRPTDRFMNISLFFQDYLRRNKNIKVHSNLSIGTGLPYGVKGNNTVYRNTYRFKAYHRLDVGFSFQMWSPEKRIEKPKGFFRFTRSAWLSLEVFNLLNVQNEASNTWIKTIFQQQYAIPNYLTSRRLNLRLKLDF